MSRITLRLPALRSRKRLSQRQLSALAGVRPGTVSALERGKSYGIRFETLARLCDALDREPGELLAIEHDSHEVPTLGGPEEDDLLRQRLANPGRLSDGPSFMRELLGETGHARRQAG